MKYKLTIGNYAGMIRFIVLFMVINFFIIITFAISLKNEFIQLEKDQFAFIFPTYFIIFILTFAIGIKQYYSSEFVELVQTKLLTKRFGEIAFENISKHKTSTKGGYQNLVIHLKNGKKYVFAPSNNFTPAASIEFSEFKNDLLGKITVANKV